jgi:hypothetical protein
MRTTIDIDDAVLKDLKRLQRREGKSLGRLVSDLLARALQSERSAVPPPDFHCIHCTARPMGARIDLADKHALFDAIDEPAQ